MQCELHRNESGDKATLGSFFVNGKFECHTLELPWKDNERMVSCIPLGSYQLEISWSQRFGRPMIRVLNVPGRDGILIHPGNTDANTEGCILVGYKVEGPDLISGSTAAYSDLKAKIAQALDEGEVVTLVVMEV